MTDPLSPTVVADDAPWLALVVGNSRLHWAAFWGEQILGLWHTPHLSEAQAQGLIQDTFAPSAWAALAADFGLRSWPWEVGPSEGSLWDGPGFSPPPPLWLASVVQNQGQIWHTYDRCVAVTTENVPLGNRYATLGVDRALALVGAGDVWGWPVLVVDGGTALTLTAGVAGDLVGGALWPGLRAQFRALHDYTDGLPLVSPAFGGAVNTPVVSPWTTTLPPRWATTTAEAMVSGVVYGQLAGLRDFIADWRQIHTQGRVVFTGGDGPALAAALITQIPAWEAFIQVEAALTFWGLRVCRRGWG
ncbi:type III pantothenate kinase [Leptolyngbya sp. BL0902]|uniref:type III pantothenate kinase n=1 Tax=Leptolyngbya sp. BL0902 TaxID=1115757 RepID=UPI0018E798E4|nr:type III pantothenate kinase [Leptolyngbya sp. BL0902]